MKTNFIFRLRQNWIGLTTSRKIYNATEEIKKQIAEKSRTLNTLNPTTQKFKNLDKELNNLSKILKILRNGTN